MRLILISVLLTTGLAVGGCGADAGGAANRRRTVVAAFFPLAEVARAAGGPAVPVTDLTPSGAEPHDLELTPRQLDRILDADVVVYIGGRFQPAVSTAVKRRRGDSLDVLRLVPAHDREDPHLWLDPVLMGRIAAAVGRAVPGGTGRVAAYVARIRRLDREYAAGLRTCARRVIVTSHEAFHRLARRYHLVDHSIAGISPEVEPDPRRVAELVDLVKATGVTTVFTEPLVSSSLARTLARETGASTAVLDPIESSGRGSYLSRMEANLAALRQALACA